jgi:hypothetical protein
LLRGVYPEPFGLRQAQDAHGSIREKPAMTPKKVFQQPARFVFAGFIFNSATDLAILA